MVPATQEDELDSLEGPQNNVEISKTRQADQQGDLSSQTAHDNSSAAHVADDSRTAVDKLAETLDGVLDLNNTEDCEHVTRIAPSKSSASKVKITKLTRTC